MLKRFLILPVLLFVGSYAISAQVDDYQSWSIVKFTKDIDAKTSVSLTPIVRHFNNITEYQNASLDYSIKRKLGKGWHAQFLGRTWFMPERSNRQFLWLDVGYSKAINKSKLASHVRLHHAIDVKDIPDGDWVRWMTKWSFPTFGKFTATVGFEPWLRLNGVSKITRVRYEPDIKYAFSSKTSLTARYRFERSINLGPKANFNVWVITLAFKL